MIQLTTHIGRTARRLAVLAVPLLVATTGTAAAHGSGSYGGGMMGGGWGSMGGLGLFSGGMFLWPLLLIGLVLLLAYGTNREEQTSGTDNALAELRVRYARGELSDEEFEARRASITRQNQSPQ